MKALQQKCTGGINKILFVNGTSITLIDGKTKGSSTTILDYYHDPIPHRHTDEQRLRECRQDRLSNL